MAEQQGLLEASLAANNARAPGGTADAAPASAPAATGEPPQQAVLPRPNTGLVQPAVTQAAALQLPMMTAWPVAHQVLPGANTLEQLKAQLQAVVQQLDLVPSICRRGEPIQVVKGVLDWSSVKKAKASGAKQPYLLHMARDYPFPHHEYSQHRKTPKHAKQGNAGRTYTSRFRGVHQTFPTRRWEAQFRRNGKPTSLGCFDKEDEAARAYDKMMLWCEIHAAGGIKGVTNFDLSEYEKDVGWLTSISQDELIDMLRTEGRRQAVHRTGSAGAAGTKRGRSQDAATDGDSDGAAAAAAMPVSELPSPAAFIDPAAAAAVAAAADGDAGEAVDGLMHQQQQQQQGSTPPDASVGAALAAAAALAGLGPVEAQQQQQQQPVPWTAATTAAAGTPAETASQSGHTARQQDGAGGMAEEDLEADEEVTDIEPMQEQLVSNPLLSLPGVTVLGGNLNPLGGPEAMNPAVLGIGQDAMAAIQQLQQQLDQPGGGDAEAAAAAAFQIGQIAGSSLLAALGSNPAVAAAAAAAAAAAGQTGLPSPGAVGAAGTGPAAAEAAAAGGGRLAGSRGGALTPAAAGSSNCLVAAAEGARQDEAATGVADFSGPVSAAASRDHSGAAGSEGTAALEQQL